MTEPFVGKQLSARKFTVTDRLLADYHSGLALMPRTDGKVPTLVASDAENAYFNEIAFANHVGHLWMRQGWECFAPMTAGQTYLTGGVDGDADRNGAFVWLSKADDTVVLVAEARVAA